MEKHRIKWTKLQCDIAFLKECLKQNLTPKFVYNSCNNRHGLASEILKKELMTKEAQQKVIKRKIERIYGACFLNVGMYAKFLYLKSILVFIKNIKNEKIANLNNKLRTMLIKQRKKYSDSFLNMSNKQLSDKQIKLLSNTLKQPYFKGKIDETNVKIQFEKLFAKCVDKNPPLENGSLKIELLHKFTCYINEVKKSLPKLSSRFKCLSEIGKTRKLLFVEWIKVMDVYFSQLMNTLIK